MADRLKNMRNEMDDKRIYTHDEAAIIVEMFEHILSENNIKVPSPEDDEREADNDAKLYGSTYSDLLDNVEDAIIELLNKYDADTTIVTGEYSGRI